MSKTISVDVVGPSHWTYMATVMAECLDQISEAGRIVEKPAPPGVYRDALTFWKLAIQATPGAVPDNLPASLNAYVIATEALRRSSDVLPQTREDIDQKLKTYEAFLKALPTPRILNDNERQVVQALRTFFVRLKEEGESEAYSKAMHLDSMPTGFPLRQP